MRQAGCQAQDIFDLLRFCIKLVSWHIRFCQRFTLYSMPHSWEYRYPEIIKMHVLVDSYLELDFSYLMDNGIVLEWQWFSNL